MPGLFESVGARAAKEIKYAPLFVEDLWSGLYTNRAALHDSSGIYERRYLGGRPGTLIGGTNVEVSVRNTIIRRPGLSPFSTTTYPTAPSRAFSFEDSTGTIRVIIDTGSTGPMSVTSCANASAGTTVYTGVFPAGAVNGLANLWVQITGFVTNPQNNGTFNCVSSTATTLTLSNATGVAETIAASAVSTGAVYLDNQNGTKLQLWAKLPGAGQSYFVAVAGLLYAGDGITTHTYTPGNPNGVVWGWGIAAPLIQPSVTVVPSGSSAVAWTANVFWSTMGLLNDGVNVQQLINVNASGTNADVHFGTSGNGSPAWNNTPGGTTTDNTITWTNFGPIVAWTAHTTFNNGSIGGNGSGGAGNSCIIYDPITKSCYINANPGLVSGISGSTPPKFKAGIGQSTQDNTIKWFYLGSLKVPQLWQKSHSYPKLGSVSNDDSVCSVVEPVTLANGLPTSTVQTVYWQTSGGGTSASSATAPPWSTQVGLTTTDGDLEYLNLGSKNWVGNTAYSGWTADGTVFSAIVDSSGNFQVCTTTGTSGSGTPTWAAGYGQTTKDGSVVWTCVGSASASTWTASQKWYRPTTGFAPPSSSQPFGGAAVLDSNAPVDVEFITNSGLGGGSAPTWATVGNYTVDNPTSNFTLTQVTVSGTTTTYTGTITGGGSNAFAGRQFLISGFANAGNNILITVTASTGSTLVCTTTSQVNESASAHAKTGAIWFNLVQFSPNSFSWSFGLSYAYSYKARSGSDFYSTPDPVTGALPVPPGLQNALPAATGSLTGAISTASPAFNIVGADTGAVNTVQGFYSNDPQVDTIVIWRSTDELNGSSNMLELTEIPNIVPQNGTSKNWTFLDYLPQTPTAAFPGLNPLSPAPIDDVNDPPPSTFLPMEFNFERIWGASGQQIFFSGGPDTLVGNPQAAFNPADEFPFLSNVVRAVRSTQGLIVYTSNSIEVIRGGPETSSFYSVTLAPGIGLGNFNALDVFAGEQFFMDTKGQLRVLSPTLSLTSAGFPIADQLLLFNPKTAYVTFYDGPNDAAIFIGTGSSTYNGATGWFRMNPRQIPGGANGPEPVFSPFATITGGCQMLQSVEIAPGDKRLLVGSTSLGQEILKRDFSVFTDNGTAYPANFQLGSLWLAHRGEIAILKFIEGDFAAVTTNPTVSYLLNEISGTFSPFTLAPQPDPPSLFGDGGGSSSYNAFRYYFSGTGSLARTVHMQIGFDFKTTSNADEIFNFTIFGGVAKNM